MRRIYRGARNAFYIVAAGTTALATGVQHGRLSVAIEVDSPDVEKLRRRYLRARGLFCSVMERASRCDRHDAEDMADAAGFPARATDPAGKQADRLQSWIKTIESSSDCPIERSLEAADLH